MTILDWDKLSSFHYSIDDDHAVLSKYRYLISYETP